MRYERKYRIIGHTLAEVRQVILQHPGAFRQQYPDRQIHNIYFDTPDLYTLFQNRNGSPTREKYRLRWYGSDIYRIRDPQFEIKRKHRDTGSKEIHKMENGSLKKVQPYVETIRRLALPLAYALSPTLLNSYERSYFISHNEKFRITLDRAVKYYLWIHHASFRTFDHWDDAVILELKYDLASEKNIESIIRFLPFRQTKNSKYALGLVRR